jgi:hypothetical protein
MNTMIEVYENAFSKEYCETLIQQFENFHSMRETIHNNNISRNSDDRVMYDWSPHFEMNYNGHDIAAEFYGTVDKCYQEYADKYDILKTCSRHTPKGMCVQRTTGSQGYHIWHIESGGLPSCNRVTAYTLYLNDIEEGGETEYLYQGIKIKPKQGLVAIWPAGITHPHRGNPVYNEYKYIVTGWYSFDE